MRWEKPDDIIKENKRRLDKLQERYDPIRGSGCYGERVKVKITDYSKQYVNIYLPKQMMDEPIVQLVAECQSFQKATKVYNNNNKNKSYVTTDDIILAFLKVRFKYDFEFWCYTQVKIKPKAKEGDFKTDNMAADDSNYKGGYVPFKLNRGQRKYLTYLLDDFFAMIPIRIILLKARQWGGSTLTQIFMMWIQLIHRRNWNSVICAHIENSARIIKGMYNIAIKEMPYILIDGADSKLYFAPYEGSQKTRVIPQRGCRITIGSAEKPEGLRGEDLSMAHFSEVASYKATDLYKPEDLVQSIVSGIDPTPYSFICFESTAKGVGNYFHRQFVDAQLGKTAYTAVFIAWFDIEYYSRSIENYSAFIKSMSTYELFLFEQGATLENINWYRHKKAESTDEWRFKSEFPSTPTEAFQSTGSRYFNIETVNRLRPYCNEPDFVGDIISDGDYGVEALQNIRFIDNTNNGKMKVWAKPDRSVKMNNRYVVVVDVNRGISTGADNGIILVLDRYWMGKELEGKPEVVAEWCGHIIPRYFIWIAVKIAVWYCNAYLVVESNTPESMGNSGFILDSVFDEIAYVYNNMYYRETSPTNIKQEPAKKWGFHTNSASKYKICTHLQVVLANDMYIERNIDAVTEMDTFETKPNGSLGAVEGCHDDRVITRALGLWICYKHLTPPFVQTDDYFMGMINDKKIINESSI